MDTDINSSVDISDSTSDDAAYDTSGDSSGDTSSIDSSDINCDTLESIPESTENISSDDAGFDSLDEIPNDMEWEPSADSDADDIEYEDLNDIPEEDASVESDADDIEYEDLNDISEEDASDDSDTGDIEYEDLNDISEEDASVESDADDIEYVDLKDISEEDASADSDAGELNADAINPQDDLISPRFPAGQDMDTSSEYITEAQDLNDISGWLGEINPNFDEFDTESPYSNNCGSCALAVYNRLNGEADAVATAENIGYNHEMTALTGMDQISMSPDEIESRLLAEGDGAHAIIGVDRAQGPGHWFNAACINGKVVAIDGQSGEVFDWPPDYGDVVNWEMSVANVPTSGQILKKR